jgi:hypothetical protein
MSIEVAAQSSSPNLGFDRLGDGQAPDTSRRAAGKGFRAWWVLRLRKIGQYAFAATDARARQYGWQIEERRGGLSRRYRDPRFDTFATCPRCHGSGATRRDVPCRQCGSTGRVTTSPRAGESKARRSA